MREATTTYARLKDGIPLSEQVDVVSNQLLEALDCVRDGIRARESYEIEQMRQEHDRKSKDLE